MLTNGEIIIIEDDLDDQSFFTQAYQELGYDNKLVFFDDGNKAIEYLSNTTSKPFLIISDINMPLINGFLLRDKIRENTHLHNKCIPYLFFSTASSQKSVIDAYNKSVQGFFVKPNTFSELKITIYKIMSYWTTCISPNNY